MSAPEEPERELTHRFEYLTQEVRTPAPDSYDLDGRMAFILISTIFFAVFLGFPVLFGDPGDLLGPAIPYGAAWVLLLSVAAAAGTLGGWWIWRRLGHPFGSAGTAPPPPWAPPHPEDGSPRD